MSMNGSGKARHVAARIVVAGIVSLFQATATMAHSPHDVIESLAVVPGVDGERETFVIVQKALRKSTDGGATWTRLMNGLDNDHPLHSVAASPSYQVDGTLFVSTSGSGIYRSTDRGASWSKVGDGLDEPSIGQLAISPDYAEDGTILAAGRSSGLYMSDDRGERWRSVHLDDVEVTAIRFLSRAGAGEIVVGDDRGRLHRSTDHGETWSAHGRVENGGAVTAILHLPRIGPELVLLCGTEKRGVVQVVDGGAAADMSDGMLDTYVTSLAISPVYADDSTILATTWSDGVYRTRDDGRTWQRSNLGLTADPQSDMMGVPHFTELRPSYLGSDRTLFLAGFDGLFESSDGALTWSSLETDALGRIEGVALSPRYDTDGTIAFSTYRLGAFLSTDRGETWRLISQEMNTRLADIELSSQDGGERIVFATSTDFFWRSTTEGASWDRIDLPARDWQSIFDAAKRRLFGAEVDTSDVVSEIVVPQPGGLRSNVRLAGTWDGFGLLDAARRIWRKAEQQLTLLGFVVTKPWTVRARAIVVSPDFAADRTVYVSSANNRIFRSTDGGQTWSVIWRGRRKGPIAIAISPDFANDATLFVSTSSDGIHVSEDRGETWRAVRPAPERGSQRLDIAISPGYADDRTVFAGNGDGLVETNDGGESWRELDYPHRGESSPIEAIAIAPSHAEGGNLLISVRGRGLYRYEGEQGGFTPMGVDLIDGHHVLDQIVFSPTFADDATLYGASDEALLRSTDGGQTWHLVDTPVHPVRMTPSGLGTVSANAPLE